MSEADWDYWFNALFFFAIVVIYEYGVLEFEGATVLMLAIIAFKLHE